MEGSVQVDNGGGPTLTSTPAQITDVGTEVKDSINSGSQEIESQDNKSETTDSEVKLTEKGTKLDPNPESAIHQQLANERKLRTDYETVLKSPELLKKFAREAGYSLTEAKEALEEEVYSQDNLQTGADVAKALNEIRSTSVKEAKTYREQIQKLEKELGDLKAGREIEQVTTTIKSDILAIQGKYPELNPKDPSYDKDLETEIAEMYNELDFDQQTGGYRGQYSIAKLTDRIMRAAGKAKKKGSQEAQTDIKVKERGKIVTSSKPSNEGAESDDPGTAIAQRIAKSFKR